MRQIVLKINNPTPIVTLDDLSLEDHNIIAYRNESGEWAVLLGIGVMKAFAGFIYLESLFRANYNLLSFKSDSIYNSMELALEGGREVLLFENYEEFMKEVI